MTDRRLPSKIIAKKKHSRVIFWGILIAFISAVSGFLLIYFLDVGKGILNDSDFIASDNTEVENKDPSWEESVYNFEDMDKFEEDVIADQAVENSDLVQIFKEQERSAKSPTKKEPKWLKNAAPWPYKLNRPMVAVVINDISQSKKAEWKQLKKYDVPLAYTISTDSKNYVKLANLGKKKGREVIAHIPMQPLYPQKLPKSLQNKKWLRTNESKRNLEEYLERLLEKTPYVVGVSNQMGSAFTSDVKAMEKLLTVLKGRGYIFLDSMTTKGSKALDVARDMTAPYLRRHLSFTFKDKKIDIQDLADRMLEKNKYLVVFVNPEADALKKTLGWIRKKQEEGVSFVPLTALMRRSMVQQKLPLNIDQKSKVFLRSPGLV